MIETIRQIMAQVFQVDSAIISDHVTQKEIEKWDSLRHLNLMIALEEKFGLSFEPEEISELTSMDRITEMIKKKQK